MRASGVTPTENGYSRTEHQHDGNGNSTTEHNSSSRSSKSRSGESRSFSAVCLHTSMTAPLPVVGIFCVF